MKIALMGAVGSGKTVYFSAVYHRFRNVVTWPILTEKKHKEYLERRIDKQVGFRLQLSDLKLESNLATNGEKLMQCPIRDWPESTNELDKAGISVRFDFAPVPPLAASGSSSFSQDEVRSYTREIDIYDPTGEVFKGNHLNSQQIIAELQTCDVAIVFIPADKLLEAENIDVDEDGWAAIAGQMALGRIRQVIDDLKKEVKDNDTFPLCFVISKSDLLFKRENSVAFINELVYNRLLIPLSNEYPNFMICACPISVVDPKTGNFKSSNLEWPFVFAAGGTLLRNYKVLMAEAIELREAANVAQTTADELVALRKRSLWDRFRRWWADDFATTGDYERLAASHRDVAGRKILRADDDRALARDIWSSITVEGREQRGIRVLMKGRDIDDPRIGVF